MSKATQKSKLDTQANEVLKTQIDVSINAARSLIHSWLPAPMPGEKMDDDEDQDLLFAKFSTGRPDRLGLGAKYLSHNEAMKLQQGTAGAQTKQQRELKNKILNQNQRAASRRNEGNHDTISNKRTRPISKDGRNTGRRQDNDDNSDDGDHDDDEKSGRSMKKKKTIGGQGDFLSMYLNERSHKKKNKGKK